MDLQKKNQASSLFDIIKSLSKEEKAYVGNYLSLFAKNKDSKTKRLYNAYAKEHAYDKNHIMKTCGITQDTHYRNQKKYLSELVLKALSQFDSNKDDINRIIGIQMQVRSLIKRKFYNEAIVICQKQIEELEGSSEASYFQSQFYHLLYHIFTEMRFETQTPENLTNLIFTNEQRIAALQKMTLNFKIIGLQWKTQEISGLKAWMTKTYKDDLATLLELSEKLRSDVNRYHDAALNVAFHATRSTIYHTQADYKSAKDEIERGLHFFETGDFSKDPNITRHCSKYINLGILSFLSDCDHKPAFSKILNFEKNYGHIFVKKNFAATAMYRYIVDLLEFEFALAKGTAAQIENWILREEELRNCDYAKNTRSRFTKSMAFCFAYAKFLVGNYQECKKQLNGIRDSISSPDENIELQAAIRLLELAVLYKTGAFDLLEYVVIRHNRYLQKNMMLGEFEAALIGFIRKDLIKQSSEERKKVISLYKSKISQYINEQAKVVVYLFDIERWLESEMEDLPMIQCIERNKPRKFGPFMPLS